MSHLKFTLLGLVVLGSVASTASAAGVNCYDNPGLIGLSISEDAVKSASRSKALGRTVAVYTGFVEMLERTEQISFEADTVIASATAVILKGDVNLGTTAYSKAELRIPQDKAEGYFSFPVRGAMFTRSFDRCYL